MNQRERPIYKQIISGICYSVIISLVLLFFTISIYTIIPIINTPLGKFMTALIGVIIGVPTFIAIFEWSKE